MLHISTQKLIEKLLERTQNGTIDWKERVPEGVILETEGYVVELTDNPLTMRLSQSNGRLLENVPIEILQSAQNSEGQSFEVVVRELLTEADRFARGTEQAIASILDAVESSTTPVLKKKVITPTPENTQEAEDAQANTPETLSELDEVPAELISETPETIEIGPITSDIPTADFSGSPENPDSEAGMNAAVSKMVAEINGFSEHDATSDPESAGLDVQAEDAGTPTDNTPPDDISDLVELDFEVPHAPDSLTEEDTVPDFKTHIVSSSDHAPEKTDVTPPPAQAGLELTSEDIATKQNDWVVDLPEDMAPEPTQSQSEARDESGEYDDIVFIDDEPDIDLPPPPITPSAEKIDISSRDGVISSQEKNTDTLSHFPRPSPINAEIPPEAPTIPPENKQDQLTADAPKTTAPQPVGFSFRSKVTATGLALAGKVGTLVEGVPDDIRHRVDEHERNAKLQKEKLEAEKRAVEAQKAVDEAARKSTLDYKSWS